jgi:hypothetical protein
MAELTNQLSAAPNERNELVVVERIDTMAASRFHAIRPLQMSQQLHVPDQSIHYFSKNISVQDSNSPVKKSDDDSDRIGLGEET